MLFETRVNGIPCQCRVLNYEPSISYQVTGPGVGDCHPSEDGIFSFELLDRKSYKAPWLERYVNPNVEDRLYYEFLDARRAEEYGFY